MAFRPPRSGRPGPSGRPPGRPRGGDDWRGFPTTGPAIRPEDGIATSRQRGAMAESWWSGRLIALLDSYGLGGRMQRGRRYARQGQLVSFEVEPGAVAAQVQGSRAQPYRVTVTTVPVTDAQWAAVTGAMTARAAFAARLLAGEVPPELEAVFDEAGVPLLPRRWADVTAACSCPDHENPCKHIAAVLYVLADQLDADPWLLLAWRGRDRDAILAPLRGPAAAGPVPVAPWWPLVPGAKLPLDDGPPRAWALSDPAGTLARLGPLDAAVHHQPVTDLLAAAYDTLAATPPEGA